ncbi:MAG: sensor histidine kinase [Lactovum sp.]
MKKSIIITFIASFILVFSLCFSIFIFFETEGILKGENIDLSLVFSSKALVFSFFMSLCLSMVLVILNYADNIRISQKFSEDIKRLSLYEKVENPEFKKIQDHLFDLSLELERLSQPATEIRQDILEEERKRISRELHDSVSQELFAATMILSSIQNSSDLKTVHSQTALSLKILHEAQNEMRALLLHLRPVELSGKSLSVGLTALINELSAKISININYRLDDVSTSSVIEDNLFRMAQEILSNTLRHAQAQNIEINLLENKEYIFLIIADDGIGFNQDEKLAASYGLSNLKERALLMSGRCTIISAPHEGTKVKIQVKKRRKVDEKD